MMTECSNVGPDPVALGPRCTWKEFYHEIRFKTRQAASKFKGKYRGPVVSGIKDARTGEFFSAKNELYLPDNLHPILVERGTKLSEVMDIKKLREDAKISGIRWPYSTPGTHAEIHALNEALWARESAGIPVNLDEFYMNNRWLTNSLEAAHRCGYCANLTNGVNAISDR